MPSSKIMVNTLKLLIILNMFPGISSVSCRIGTEVKSIEDPKVENVLPNAAMEMHLGIQRYMLESIPSFDNTAKHFLYYTNVF